MRRNQNSDWFRRPELLLSDLIRRAARGDIAGNDPHLLRATVLAVDPDGGKLENPTGSGTYQAKGSDGRKLTISAEVGPLNPVGSVKARVLTDGLDRLRGDPEVRVFWPLFPQDQLAVPIAPGEHVYIMFEDLDMVHGLWIARVSGHQSAGNFQGKDSYTAPHTRQTAMDLFEPNAPDYPSDDATASMAPSRGAIGIFGGED